ncbi:MAG: type 4a pilus biogenesis protein PilO [Gammaproteobacteria bacterium]|nr:type 4a pilus biogenesis protein PilO [Gammaproteobacteria bacterium]
MNFLQQLRQLDFNDIGRWPFVFHVFFVGIFFVFAACLGFYLLVWQQQIPLLEQAERKEVELREVFEAKQRKAANFTVYKAQLEEIERSFGTMLRQLPGQTEIPNLLVDISQTGLAAGLQEELFQPLEEVRMDFYAEKPIKIRLRGSYHEFGRFVSDIAALPRIVTLHDVDIAPADKDASADQLVLNVTAKTYRYLDELEGEAAGGAGDTKVPIRPRSGSVAAKAGS